MLVHPPRRGRGCRQTRGMRSGNESAFVSVHRAAVKLGVPVEWLRTEAVAGRLPALKIGRRLLFNVAAVHQALQDRGRSVAGGPDRG